MRGLDTLVGRLVLVSLLAITLMHVLSLWTYERALEGEVSAAREAALAERIVSIKRSVVAVPPARREALAHELSSGPLEAHWNETRGAAPGGPGGEAWRQLVRRIADLAIELTPADIILGTGEDPHVALLSIRLPDSTWLNVSLFDTRRPRQARHGALLSTSLMAVGVALLAFVVARWLSRPLVEMAGRVRRLRPDDGPSPLAETGPSEVRELASAFNAMQRRVADSVAQRTRSLAAVSHDLRTPLTRLRLRLDEVGDPALRDAIGRDIGDMEQMISATLAYLRGDGAGEPRRPVDLVALLGTIVDDAVDAGRSATLVAPDHAVVQARHLGIKRAVTNLVDNALRFGGEVRVELRLEAAHAVVTVEDDGPGIPEDHLENVLEPFVRLEDSRNAETGGVGLGLTIARAAVEADGGSLALANRPEGGLSATIRLPLPVR